MIRIKIPGGVLSNASGLPRWPSSTVASARATCTSPPARTSRLISCRWNSTAEALEYPLFSHGMTTREACGNTFRNITACALSGNCPREHVDAGRKSRSGLRPAWIRSSAGAEHAAEGEGRGFGLRQPTAPVSASMISGFVAVEKDGKKGFRVFSSEAGLGSQPQPDDRGADLRHRRAAADGDGDPGPHPSAAIPTASTATPRASSSWSSASGPEKFTALFQEEFDRLLALPQRPWEKLDWREPGEADVERTPMGVVRAA